MVNASVAPAPIMYGQSYSIIVSDPAAVVAALTKYRNSETGKASQSMVALSMNVANGEYESTHGINVFYANPAAMDATNAALAGSKDAAEFRDAMNTAAVIESENVFTMLRSVVNSEAAATNNPLSMLFGLNVTDAEAFNTALATLVDSDAAKAFPGNLYFGQTLAMGDSDVTHWASFQADSMDNLLNGLSKFMASADFAVYAKDADDFREIENRMVTRELMRFMPSAG